MAPHKTVTINGRAYDAVTGLPVEPISVTNPDKTSIKKTPAPAPAKKPAPKVNRGTATSEMVHSSMQRSQTLIRRATKKPAVPNKPITKRSSPGHHMDIAKSTSVARFAAHPKVEAPAPVATTATKTTKAPSKFKRKPVKPTKSAASKVDTPARIHPLAQRALHRNEAKKPVAAAAAPGTAKEIKDAAISKALATPTPKSKTVTKKNAKGREKNLRKFVIIGAIALVVIAALYAAWRFIPNISVSIAAAQAGIEASYPEYTPDGFSLSQPVTYSEGEVDLKFTSNSNDHYYTVSQARSSWDSSAVLDKVITPAAGANYVTTKERGLTIYTYDMSAAWVNGGILYQIDSNAPLSGDQIRRIATSL